MVSARTSKSIRAYNLFKMMVTLFLIVIIIALFSLQGRRRAAMVPETVVSTAVPVTASATLPPTTVPPTATPTAVPVVEVPALALADVGEDGVVTVRGTGTAGSTLEVWGNGTLLDTVVIDADGVWRVKASLESGAYDISARVVDTEGRIVVESEAVRFVVETPEPLLPMLVSPQDSEIVTGETVTLTGTGEPGAEVEILDQDEVVGTAAVQADGTWLFLYEAELGLHAIAVRTVGGRSGATANVEVVAAEAVETVAIPDFAAMEFDCSAGDAPEGIDLGDTYIVAPCEFLGLIAVRTGIDLEALLAANPDIKDTDVIFPGQVLNLPPH